MIIDYEDDKENMPNESDYEDLPSMYKDEDDDVDEDDEDDEDDDSIFTSEWRLKCITVSLNGFRTTLSLFKRDCQFFFFWKAKFPRCLNNSD